MKHQQKSGYIYRYGHRLNLASKARGTRRAVLLGVAVLVIVISAVVFKLVSAPVHGHQTMTNKKVQQAQHAKAPVTPSAAVQSDYFSLDTPSGYRVQSTQAVVGLLYQATLIKPSTSGSMVVSIGLKSLTGTLEDEPAYQLRKQQTQRYTLITQNIQSDMITIANDKTSAAIVAFWPHHQYLATIAISSGIDNPAANDNDQEIAALQPLLVGWHWQ